MEIQQTDLYMKYIEKLGWSHASVDGILIIYRRIPLVGTIVKIQRPLKLPAPELVIPVLKKIRARTVAVEPHDTVSQPVFTDFCTELKKAGFHLNRSPFLPTKTIRIDIAANENEIFNRFNEAKRRGVRKAAKNGVTVAETDSVTKITETKNRASGWLGFITTYGIRELWSILPGKMRTGIIARHPSETKPLGCILLIFFDRTAYYWIAGSTKKGKRLHAPTLLVFEALKLAKKRGMKNFDFVGVFDERMPKANREWLGFTKFKEGFGGTPVYYPISK